MRIALVRHGETAWNRERRWQGRSNLPLNDLGRRQAAAAVPLLSDHAWSWMVSSPLQRAHRTALTIAQQLDPMPITLDDELIEQDWGEADGMRTVDAAERWPDGAIPGLEVPAVLRRRAARAMNGIAERMSGDGIVVSHGGVIRAALQELCAIEPPRILNCAVSVVERDRSGWRAIDVNRAPDLGDADQAVGADQPTVSIVG